MKVIVLTGPESSGKSCLVAALAARYGAPAVNEYVRQYIDEQRRETCYADISVIAQGQLAAEDRARTQEPPLLLLDTHLLSNILWSRTLFNDCPTWIEPALLERRYNLHLLLSPDDVDWIDDDQRCQPDLAQRRQFFRQCESWLQSHAQPYQVIRGSWQQRQDQTMAAVEALLAQ